MKRIGIIGVIAWAALAIPALAHDPGLSAVSLQRQGDQLSATVNFAPADAIGLTAHALEIQVDGQTLLPVEPPVTRNLTNDVQLQMKFILPPGRRLTVHSTLLGTLARGHRQYFSLTDSQGRTVLTRILAANDDRVEVDLTHTMTAPRLMGFVTFVRHGILHILTGYDHLLFVTALALAVVGWWDLIKVVGAFTLAHTITLTLAVLNIVRLPSHIVEPIIAGSIVFVALTNVFWPQNCRGKARLATALFFGLFHGLGFAGGLLDAMEGLPGLSVALAIVAFSLGVELGHQMIVLPVFSVMKFVRSRHIDEAARNLISLRAMRYGSAIISVAGVMYLVAALRE